MCVCVYQSCYSPRRRRAVQVCCGSVPTGRSRVQGLRCRKGRLQCLEGQAGRWAHQSLVPDPGLARRNKTPLSVGEEMSPREFIMHISGRVCPTCLSNCSLLVIDNGASNGFSSFSVSSAVCVFVTAPARGSRSTYFLYLPKHTNASARRKYFIRR